MSARKRSTYEGQVLDDRTEITIVQLCQRCAVESELVHRMVAEGILEPSRQEGSTMYFPLSSTKRTQVVLRLRSDLGVNMAGAALALELLEQINQLKSQLQQLKRGL